MVYDILCGFAAACEVPKIARDEFFLTKLDSQVARQMMTQAAQFQASTAFQRPQCALTVCNSKFVSKFLEQLHNKFDPNSPNILANNKLNEENHKPIEERDICRVQCKLDFITSDATLLQ